MFVHDLCQKIVHILPRSTGTVWLCRLWPQNTILVTHSSLYHWLQWLSILCYSAGSPVLWGEYWGCEKLSGCPEAQHLSDCLGSERQSTHRWVGPRGREGGGMNGRVKLCTFESFVCVWVKVSNCFYCPCLHEKNTKSDRQNAQKTHTDLKIRRSKTTTDYPGKMWRDI